MNSKEHVVRIVDEVPADFWRVIGASGGSAPAFRRELQSMDKRELAGTCWTFEELANQLRSEWNRDDTLPDVSEDSLLDVANWIVTLGKERYREFLQHPERLPKAHDNPGFVDELIDEYRTRFGEDLPPNTCAWDPEWRAHGRQSPWIPEEA